MNKKSFYSIKFLLIAIFIISLIIIFIISSKENREPLAYAIFITIIISGADSIIISKLWKKIKGKEKNPLI